MLGTAILVIPIEIKLDDICFVLTEAINYDVTTIIVHLHSNHYDPFEYLPNFSDLIIKIYRESVKLLTKIDIKVHIRNLRGTQDLIKLNDTKVILLCLNNLSKKVQDHYSEIYGCSKLIVIQKEIELKNDMCFSQKTDMYDTVVLGGTFDRLHIGHKILLTESILRSRKRVVVGVTDENMVRKGKVLPELILPLQKRIQDVQNFLFFVDNTLTYEVVPISDPFGPTATDPDMDMIVVSGETYIGGKKVNELRAQRGLCELKIHTISLIEHFEKESINTQININEQKISSSRNRYNLLGKYIENPRQPERICENVYVVGLIENTIGENFLKNSLATKDVIMLQVDLNEPQKCIEVVEKISAESETHLVFLIFGTSMESELIKKCQEIWFCLSSTKFLTERILKIANILFTSSIPLEPQVHKAWEGLIKRINYKLK